MDKNIIKNVASLFGIQGMNYIIPLITLPYLVKTLGPESYGALGFSLAFVQYFCLITDYGFNLSASRKIAICANDKDTVSTVFWHVLTCKSILAVACFVFLSVLSLFIPIVQEHKAIIFAAYGLVLGNILFPVWLFQGKEQMVFSSFANILSRLLAVPLIFMFINNQHDAVMAAWITSLTALLGGVISVVVLIKKRWIAFKKIEVEQLISEYKDGWHVFLSTAAISLYTTSITVVLGFIAGPIAVGYFVAADKLRQAVQGLLVPISQAIYPRVNSLMVMDPSKGILLLKKLFKGFAVLGFALSAGIFIFAKVIIDLLYGLHYEQSITVLYVLAICPFLVALSNVLGIQTMLVLGYKKEFSWILIASGIVCLTILFPLSYFYEAPGAALAVLMTELSVTIMMFFFVKKKKIQLF